VLAVQRTHAAATGTGVGGGGTVWARADDEGRRRHNMAASTNYHRNDEYVQCPFARKT
jgi:hypothetical protein